MSLLGISAVVTFLLALILGASAVLTPVAALHVIFAIGIVPLIFGAMLHFVPVLTRTGAPHRLIAAMPYAAQMTGIVIVLVIDGLQGTLARSLLHPLSALELLIALSLIGWVIVRARRTVGRPHPGWRWYVASLILFSLAVAAIPFFTSGIHPAAARLFHLHANTLGFIGLAALGTLPVLMPTVLRTADPQAAPWLQRRLPVAFAAVLFVAAGSAFVWPMALIGGAFLVVVALGLLAHWVRRLGSRVLLQDGAALSLVAALSALVLLLLTSAGHAVGAASAEGFVLAFVAGFLMPLVTGALSQLLPVWRFAGTRTAERTTMRALLTRRGPWRAPLFVCAAGAFVLGLPPVGWVVMAGGIGLFLLDLAMALRVGPSTR